MSQLKNTQSACKIKVCGVTREEDFFGLLKLNVDFLGFNFYRGSARFITPEKAKAFVVEASNAISVGVFVNAPLNELLDIIKFTGIKYAQLHGSEDLAYIKQVPIPVIKALPHTALSQMQDWEKSALNLEYLLIDTLPLGSSGKSQFGGSGLTFDWSELNKASISLPYFLAGGLGPHNLQEALAICSPFAVDLNSKVEVAPGIKDLEKVKCCVEIIRTM